VSTFEGGRRGQESSLEKIPEQRGGEEILLEAKALLKERRKNDPQSQAQEENAPILTITKVIDSRSVHLRRREERTGIKPREDTRARERARKRSAKNVTEYI
jgi:hypothetical protein